MHRAGLRRLGSIHERFPWIAIVLALQERPRADLAEIIQVGAGDLIPLHADDEELRRTLARAARITRGRLGVVAHGPAGAGRGRIVMVSSASGGCGKTFLATNAAEFLARTTDQPVVLVDLDLQFGEVSTALRLRPDYTITDALAAEAEGYDLEEILDEYLLPHPDGFKVLAAPRLPGEADSVTPGDITRILDVLRARRAWVVIDTHEGLSDLFVAALEATDHVFAVATPDRPSLVNLGRFLGALEGLGMAAANISVVLNKAEDDTGLDPVDMVAQLGRRFEAIVPYSRDVSLSVNVGVPLIVGKPKSPDRQAADRGAGNRPAREPAGGAVRSPRRGAGSPRAGRPRLLRSWSTTPGLDRSTRSAAALEAPDGEPAEIDLTENQPRPLPGHCPSAARQPLPVVDGRAPSATAAEAGDRPTRAPAGLAHLYGGRRAHRQRCGLRPPLSGPERVSSDVDRYGPTRTPH